MQIFSFPFSKPSCQELFVQASFHAICYTLRQSLVDRLIERLWQLIRDPETVAVYEQSLVDRLIEKLWQLTRDPETVAVQERGRKEKRVHGSYDFCGNELVQLWTGQSVEGKTAKLKQEANNTHQVDMQPTKLGACLHSQITR